MPILPKEEAIRPEDLAEMIEKHSDDELAELGYLDVANAYRAGTFGQQTEETEEEAAATEPEPESLAGDEGEEDGEAEAGQQGEDDPEPESGEQPRDPATGKFVPKAALDRERNRRKATDARLDRLAEIVERALSGRPPTGPQPAQADPLATAEAALVDLDRRYDAGEVDDATHRTESRNLTRAIARMEAEAAYARVALPLTTGAVQAEVSALADANADWLNALTDDAWQELLDNAQTKVARTGMTGPAADLEVKRQVVILGHKYGLDRLAESQPAPRQPGGSAAKPSPAAVAAQAGRTAAKLATAARLPPDTGRAGVARAGAADDPAAAFDRLSQKELMRRTGMPTTATQRLLDAIPD